MKAMFALSSVAWRPECKEIRVTLTRNPKEVLTVSMPPSEAIRMAKMLTGAAKRSALSKGTNKS